VDWYEALVARIPGVQGGIPVLIGTRTPVSSVVAYYETYHGDRGEVQDALAHLTPRQIRAALAYYERHRAEVDADERRHEDAWERLPQAV